MPYLVNQSIHVTYPPATRTPKTPMIETNPMASNTATPLLLEISKPVSLVRVEIKKMMYENFGFQLCLYCIESPFMITLIMCHTRPLGFRVLEFVIQWVGW
jgi:hypothetical protein